MDQFESYGLAPWHLIAASLKDELTPEEEAVLESWMASSEVNRKLYQECRRLWEEGLADHQLFDQDEAGAGWDELQLKMRSAGAAGQDAEGWRVGGRLIRKKMVWLVVAAVCAGAILGAGLVWRANSRETIYAAGTGQQRTLILPDSTSVELHAGGRLRLARGFNAGNRTVFLDAGEATFDIARNASQVFTIAAGSASIRDIGTRVTVQMEADSVMVTLLSGKVDFQAGSGRGGETRQLRPGMALTYYPSKGRFGVPILMGLTDQAGHNVLRFDRAPLGEVTRLLQQMSGRPILLADSSLARRPLTARLDGESFDDAIKIICVSLDLEYAQHGDSTILNVKGSR